MKIIEPKTSWGQDVLWVGIHRWSIDEIWSNMLHTYHLYHIFFLFREICWLETWFAFKSDHTTTAFRPITRWWVNPCFQLCYLNTPDMFGKVKACHTVDGPAKSCTTERMGKKPEKNNNMGYINKPPINWCRISQPSTVVPSKQL